jgi:succinyl-CoA:acetate CoA-transferase
MRNGYLTIFTTESTAKDDKISRIVPMCSHVDSTEHDIHVFITEWGVADMRGLAPRERPEFIINNCAHPIYRDQLLDYFSRARKDGGHTPHLLDEALSWQVNFKRNGSMMSI